MKESHILSGLVVMVKVVLAARGGKMPTPIFCFLFIKKSLTQIDFAPTFFTAIE